MTAALVDRRRTRSDDPYTRRSDLAEVVALQRIDSRTLQPAIATLVADLLRRDPVAGREISTISAAKAMEWVIGEVVAGRRTIGHQEVVDRFGLSLSTVDRMLAGLRAVGILWAKWTGTKNVGYTLWSLAPRAVSYLGGRIAQLRVKSAELRERWKAKRDRGGGNRSRVNTSKTRTGSPPLSRGGSVPPPPPPPTRPTGPACPKNEYLAAAECPYCRAFPGLCAQDAQRRADLAAIGSGQVRAIAAPGEEQSAGEGQSAAQRAMAAAGWTPPKPKRRRRFNYDAAFRGSTV